MISYRGYRLNLSLSLNQQWVCVISGKGQQQTVPGASYKEALDSAKAMIDAWELMGNSTFGFPGKR